MMHELIRAFAKENFNSSYHVAPQGHHSAIQPLALIVKEKRAFWKIGKKNRKVVMEILDTYLSNSDSMKSEVIALKESQLQKGEQLQVHTENSASENKQVKVAVGENLAGGFKRHHELGKLNLTSVQEEFYGDMALREILSKAKLNPAKMAPYEKSKLYIITGVVYSEKLEISGKRETHDTIDAQLKIMPRISWFSDLTSFKGGFLKSKNPPPSISRKDRSSLLFTCAKVKYASDSSCLELQGLVGALMKSGGMLDVVADSAAKEFDVMTKDQAIYEDLMQSSENKPEEKLNVVRMLLDGADNPGEMDRTIKQYLKIVDDLMKPCTTKKILKTEIPLSAQFCKQLQATGIQITSLSDAKILYVTDQNAAQVKDYALIFHHLQNVPDDEWKDLKAILHRPEVSGNLEPTNEG